MKVSELPLTAPDAMTVAAGCALSYLAEEKSAILLLIRPAAEHGLSVLHEQLTVRRGAVVEQLGDAFGNALLRVSLLPGLNEIRHDAVLRLPVPPGPREWTAARHAGGNLPLPADVIRYTLPSRYCESDKLAAAAARLFGRRDRDARLAQEICDWTHGHLAYRYGSGDSTLSACEAMERGYGVCRDFAHVMIALCRALDLPARYVAGHMPLIGSMQPDSDIGIDFHAYVEVWVGGRWQVFDPRHNDPGAVHVKVAHGLDAVDTAISTFHGRVRPAGYRVWAHRRGAHDEEAAHQADAAPHLLAVRGARLAAGFDAR